jgi:hypothetical protein
MNPQRFFLGSYRMLLQLYPQAFRRRFAPEMLQLAEAAEPADWLLILGDTSVAIVRCWIEGSPSTETAPEPNPYMPLGGYPVRASGFLHGFVLSTAIILVLAYMGFRWPPACSASRTTLTHIVASPQAKAHTAPDGAPRSRP